MSLVISARAGESSTSSTSSAVIRGVTPTAYLVHKQLRIVQGRAPRPGHDEVMVGQLAATRIGWQPEALAVDKTLWFDNRPWSIVGAFAASGTVMDAEIWCPLTDLQIAAKRDSLSCVILTLDSADFSDVDIFASTRLDLEIIAMREDEYYRQLVSFYRPIRLMVWVTASLIAMGGLFGGLNTLYAAFAARFREMGMLQSLGYSRAAVALSLIQESVLISLTGALLASTVALILLEGVAVKISMGAFALVLDAPTLAIGLAAGLVLGVVGAIPPTLNCLRQPITEALKSA